MSRRCGMKALYFFTAVLITALVLPVSGATVENSIYATALTPGARDSFTMTMKADTPDEIGTPLTVGMDGGDCSQWVRLDTAGITLDSTGAPVTAVIDVPIDAVNGFHRCAVQYTAPSNGMITARIEVPFKIDVTGGTDPAPAPVAAVPEPVQEPARAVTIAQQQQIAQQTVQPPAAAPTAAQITITAPTTGASISLVQIASVLLVGFILMLGVSIGTWMSDRRNKP